MPQDSLSTGTTLPLPLKLRTRSCGSSDGVVTDANKQGNEPLGSINGGELLDQFNCYRHLMKNSAFIFLLVFTAQACWLLPSAVRNPCCKSRSREVEAYVQYPYNESFSDYKYAASCIWTKIILPLL